MTDTLTPVLTDNWDADRAWTLASYEERGGYAALDKAFVMTPDEAAVDADGLACRARPNPVDLLVGQNVLDVPRHC